MYGTVARYNIKPGNEQKLADWQAQFQRLAIPGFVAQYSYRLDGDPHGYYEVVMFESKDAYVAFANSPEQDARYREWRELLAGDPKWHDGEIVVAHPDPRR
jgi:heme-degrading monooxygenase HmoA